MDDNMHSDSDAIRIAPEINIDSVPAGERLDALVAVEIMEWKLIKGFGQTRVYRIPTGGMSWLLGFSTNGQDVREAETEIGRRGLSAEYAKRLGRALEVGNTFVGEFRLITATPEQRCRAMLRAVRDG